MIKVVVIVVNVFSLASTVIALRPTRKKLKDYHISNHRFEYDNNIS